MQKYHIKAIHKNSANKMFTAHTNIAVNSNDNNAKRACINIMATINSARRAYLTWLPAVMIIMPRKRIVMK